MWVSIAYTDCCFVCVVGDSSADAVMQVATLSDVVSTPSTPRSPPLSFTDETGATPKMASEDRVYRVATDQTIKSLMNEYKKRKLHHSMPSFHKPSRKARSSSTGSNPDTRQFDQRIENEQQASIMKVRDV